MNARKSRQNHEREPRIEPETGFLVRDLEELVTDKVGEFLGDEQFKISAKGYRPEIHNGEMPSGIDLLEGDYLMDFGTPDRDFQGIDLQLSYPLKKEDANPFNITVRWSGGVNCRLAVVDTLPILFIEEAKKNGHTLHAEKLPQEKMELYLEGLGLPESIFGSDIKELMRDLYHCPELLMTQTAQAYVDPYTRIEISHDAQLRQDMDDKKQLTQELAVKIDHLDQSVPFAAALELPLKPQFRFRNLLRFDRNEDTNAWDFRGAYSGKLGTGETLDESSHIDPKLDIPSVKVLEKALNGLNV